MAGIVSGANSIKPGLIMTSNAAPRHSRPVALTGRVYVFADATHDPIQPGDLLTTADTLGHAMKVTDYARAQGAVLGKAMSALPAGRGLLLVLVSLQSEKRTMCPRTRGGYLLASLVSVLLGCVPAAAGTVFVDWLNSGVQDGSAGHPYRRLPQALAAAAPGDTIAIRTGRCYSLEEPAGVTASKEEYSTNRPRSAPTTAS